MSSLVSCQVILSGKIIVPWTIQSVQSCDQTIKELYDVIKEDNTELSNKYEGYNCNTYIGKTKVEFDKIVMNCKVSEAISNFGRYFKFEPTLRFLL